MWPARTPSMWRDASSAATAPREVVPSGGQFDGAPGEEDCRPRPWSSGSGTQPTPCAATRSRPSTSTSCSAWSSSSTSPTASRRAARRSRPSCRPDSDDYIPNEARRAQFLEDRDEYTSHNVFWVPAEARWESIQASAKLPEIGQVIDTAMDLIEKENPIIRGVLPRNYGREGSTRAASASSSTSSARSASPRPTTTAATTCSAASTSTSSVSSPARRRQGRRRVLHAALRRQDARRDARALPRPRLRPCLRLGRHVRPVRRVREGPRRQAHRHLRLRPGVHRHHLAARQDEPRPPRHRGRPRRPVGRLLHARTCTPTCAPTSCSPTRRSTCRTGGTPSSHDDPRWKYGTPPEGNANFAWVQHFIHHLSPEGHGWLRPGQRLAVARRAAARARSAASSSRPTSSTASSPCPTSSSSTPASRSACGSSRRTAHGNGHRERAGRGAVHRRPQARRDGDASPARARRRRHRARSPAPTTPGATTTAATRTCPASAKAATLDEIEQHDFVLTPGRYVGAEEAEDDDEPIDEKIERLTEELFAEFERGRELEDECARGSRGFAVSGWRLGRARRWLGDAEIAEVASKVGSGATPRGGTSVYVDAGTAFIRSQNVYDHEFASRRARVRRDEAA